jgi:hypothetical protein
MIRQHHTTAAVAITVALAGGIAPIAAADPAPLARAEAPIAANQSQARTAVRPNPDEQTQQALGALPPILRRAQASELAVLDRSQAREADALSYSVPATARYSTAELNAYAKGVHPVAVSAPKVGTPSDGFDWGDAGIGAGATLIVLGIGFAGTRAATNGRRRQLREERAVVTN